MSILQLSVLAMASLLVPKDQRSEWFAEWKGELWQLQGDAARAFVFCLGSFRDAYWLRQNNPALPQRRSMYIENPACCLLFLAVLTASSLVLTLRLPNIPVSPELAKSLPRTPLQNFCMMICMSCLILPAITSFSLGQYPARFSLRRWMFFAAKVALILSWVYAGCLYFSYQFRAQYRLQIPVQALLVGSLLAFRWAIHDQRRRCPVCLRLLGYPANVGQPARNFLEWHGTELMCVRGHGLLHVPATPADWSPAQQWLELDSSWSELFS